MKKFLLILVILVMVLIGGLYGYRFLADKIQTPGTGTEVESAALIAEEETDASLGPSEAPDFEVFDSSGNRVSLSDQQGKPVVINFWATWCGPCKSELPSFEQAYQTYGDQVTFMMVNLTDGYRDAEEGVRSFVEENGYTFPVYFDLESGAARAYSVYSIPLTVFIDAEGSIAAQQIGVMSEETLVSQLENILP